MKNFQIQGTVLYCDKTNYEYAVTIETPITEDVEKIINIIKRAASTKFDIETPDINWPFTIYEDDKSVVFKSGIKLKDKNHRRNKVPCYDADDCTIIFPANELGEKSEAIIQFEVFPYDFRNSGGERIRGVKLSLKALKVTKRDTWPDATEFESNKLMA